MWDVMCSSSQMGKVTWEQEIHTGEHACMHARRKGQPSSAPEHMHVKVQSLLKERCSKCFKSLPMSSHYGFSFDLTF